MGAMAKNDITSSKAFMFVPYKIIISPGVCLSSEIAHVFLSHPYWFKGHESSVDYMLYVFLIFEKLKGRKSFYYPYFQVAEAPEIVSDWTPEEMDELQDPYLVWECRKNKREIDALWNDLWGVIEKYPEFFPPEQ